MTDAPTAHPQEGAAPTPSDPTWLGLARDRDWRGLAALGRFGLAAQTLRLADPDADPDTLDALDALTEVEASVRAKAAPRAAARLARLEARPTNLVDWGLLERDLAAIVEAVAAVDRREPQAARAALARVEGEYLAAERDAQTGTVLVLEGALDEARRHLEAALARDPNHVRALTNLGNLKLEAGDVDGAIADYERAIKLDDGFANAHHNLGVAYRRKGQIGKSVASLRRAQRASSKRDAEEARAALAGGRARGARWLRPVVIGALVVAALWWWSQRGA